MYVTVLYTVMCYIPPDRNGSDRDRKKVNLISRSLRTPGLQATRIGVLKASLNENRIESVPVCQWKTLSYILIKTRYI